MPKCDRKDCLKEATCTPVFIVRAKGYSVLEVAPLRVHISVKVCREHLEDYRDYFAEDAARIQLWQGLIASKLAPPDFDNITLEECPLDDPNFLTFIKNWEAHRLGAPAYPIEEKKLN